MKPTTMLRHGVTRSQHDERILQAMRKVTRECESGSGAFAVGIRNPAGAVYRVVVLYGTDQSLAFCNLLDEMGMVAQLPEVEGQMIDGCHVTYTEDLA